MASDAFTLYNVNKQVTVRKPVLYGAAGVLGLYLLSKYLQNSDQNRILNSIQNQAVRTNSLLERSVMGDPNVPKESNYPEH